MKVVTNNQPAAKKITMVCCLHGEEEFSLRVFKYFEEHLHLFPGLKLVLANEPALEKNERFLDQDLNRSFPGGEGGNREEQLAAQILNEIGQEDYLLDVHRTVSDTEMVPILTSLNEATKTIVNVLDPERVVFVEPPLADKSMIGQIEHGVSLEVNYLLAEQQSVMDQIIDLVRDLREGAQKKKRERQLYTVTGTIPKTIAMPAGAVNFKYIPELDLYPFLYHKNSYEDIHGLKATKMEQVEM